MSHPGLPGQSIQLSHTEATTWSDSASTPSQIGSRLSISLLTVGLTSFLSPSSRCWDHLRSRLPLHRLIVAAAVGSQVSTRIIVDRRTRQPAVCPQTGGSRPSQSLLPSLALPSSRRSGSTSLPSSKCSTRPTTTPSRGNRLTPPQVLTALDDLDRPAPLGAPFLPNTTTPPRPLHRPTTTRDPLLTPPTITSTATTTARRPAQRHRPPRGTVITPTTLEARQPTAKT